MKVLNLSKCSITDIGASQIAQVVASPSLIIKSLLLHWNRIRGRGSCMLAKALRRNQSLQVFDASFNSFGSSSLKVKKVPLKKSKTPRKGESEDTSQSEKQYETYTKSAY